MKIIDSKQFPERSKEALFEFLKYCQGVAEEKGRPQLASISLRVKHIDPLAVLQSIYEESAHHFYLEHPASEEAIAGAEAVASATFEGEGRFEAARQWSQDLLDNALAIGDLDLPFSGPQFFSGFTFSDAPKTPGQNEDPQSFAPATVFVPLWQVARSKGVYVAVANVMIAPGMPIELVAGRIWQAHATFSAFDYAQFEEGDTAPVPVARKEVGESGEHAQRVKAAIEAIERGELSKVVLARALDLSKHKDWNPLESLHALRAEYPTCFAFSFSAGDGKSFVGATPEKILRIHKGRLHTEAIAGSAPRAAHAREDAQLARALLESDKDLREHGCIVEDIVSQLSLANIEAEAADGPRILPLANVQHLLTPIKASLPEGVHLLDVLRALHPTPAVGGVPRAEAKKRIPEIEPFDRGLYAGALGWFNAQGEGEMVVGLRSALISGKQARLYAGGGIVAGSGPERETAETDWKFKVMLEHLN